MSYRVIHKDGPINGLVTDWNIKPNDRLPLSIYYRPHLYVFVSGGKNSGTYQWQPGDTTPVAAKVLVPA